jgi:hypothetical protein
MAPVIEAAAVCLGTCNRDYRAVPNGSVVLAKVPKTAESGSISVIRLRPIPSLCTQVRAYEHTGSSPYGAVPDRLADVVGDVPSSVQSLK